MSNEIFPQPSEGELDILQVLWKIEPATVRQVHELLSASKPVGYTTTLKQMQRMLEKNLLRREDREGGHHYRCTLPQQQARQNLVDKLAQQLFEGSGTQLAIQALGSGKVSTAELEELEKLLQALKKNQSHE
ncbi:BlaI/MecI/CopY family transcriptional regulator [Haliscomenobacter hydrossis]|uniref:Transcriptional repressor, CopY family n=1 Tax=Haliscomenobacter hydrossis (strain ATCC 27775 / DSM 1100 / LMG 10767 / O) TaxID=760192 RepID=F4KU05_HALH1|nr:BlaI/MecI/CopY family transcriptional regulator [Haliscomenobacter hydrossis]AEE49141.1 transcriptional repressor, CopY family [Haliscomenobacter hydrossis DSM 1100]